MAGTTLLATATYPSVLARSTNSTNGSFSAVTPTGTEPSGEGVLNAAPNHVLLVPFGTDADNETFDVRVIGWFSRNTRGVWFPVHLGTVTATLSSTLTGVANETPNGANDLFADSLSVSSAGNNIEVVAGVSDVLPAHVLVDTRGASLIEIRFALSSAASANAVVVKE